MAMYEGLLNRGMAADVANSYRQAKQYRSAAEQLEAAHTSAPAEYKMRTQEEILAQLEARYAQLTAEAEMPDRKWPCRSCRFSAEFYAAWCDHPLVKGFGDKVHMGMDNAPQKFPVLCGPEKALWEPKEVKLALWQRIVAWIDAMLAPPIKPE